MIDGIGIDGFMHGMRIFTIYHVFCFDDILLPLSLSRPTFALSSFFFAIVPYSRLRFIRRLVEA